ncbi:MAG TPA: M56 family metallopeptidase [Thermoanaerobaculia bacterium]
MSAHPLASSLAAQALAWMLTYLLHSTLLLGLAWLASKPLSRWSVSAEEAVWKLALVGALFTASIQLAAGWQPVAGQWRLTDVSAATVNVGAGLVPARAGASPAPTLNSRRVDMGIEARVLTAAKPTAPAIPASVLPSLPALALGAWALGALLLLAAFGRSYLRLNRRLRSRPRVVAGDLHAQLRALAAEAGLGRDVRLSCSSRVPVPVALGFGAPEICVPPRALARLTDEQQEGMLAHELAHLARRDPFWLLLGQVLTRVLFFQPLNWVARRRLREISEMLSDEWAVARTGRPLSLAGCLAEVAGWSVGVRPLPVPGMADGPSSLGRRIRRLLDETRSPDHPARRAWLAAAMGVLVIAVAAAAPAISAARPEPPSPAAAPAAPAPTVDVKDATDTPTHPATSEGAEPEGRPEHRADHEARMAEKDRDRHDARDQDGEGSPDVDVDVDAEGVDAHVNASIQAALSLLDGQLQNLSREHEMTAEQREKLSREIERATRELNRNLKPRMEKLSRELAQKLSHQVPSPEMQRLAVEMGRLAEQMRPSAEDMARLQAQVDQEMKQFRADGSGKLSREDRERIERDAREMAERMKPSEERRRKLDELRRQLDRERGRMDEQLSVENRQEIERAQKEMREEVEREVRGAREELRRALEHQRAIERQDRQDHRRQHDAQPKHDSDRNKDQDKDHRQDHDGSNGSPKPRVSLRLDRDLKCDVRVDVKESSGR